MVWRNSATGFGLTTRILHWAMMLLIVGMLILGNKIADMQPALANLYLFGVHKTLGFAVLSLTLFRVIWHRISPPPPPIGNPRAITNRLARAVHTLIYLCLIAIPLSGWIANSATGLDVMLFDRIAFPAIAPVSETWEKNGFWAHGVLTKTLIGLLGAHILGTMLRGVKQDGTLARMTGGSIGPALWP